MKLGTIDRWESTATRIVSIVHAPIYTKTIEVFFSYVQNWDEELQNIKPYNAVPTQKFTIIFELDTLLSLCGVLLLSCNTSLFSCIVRILNSIPAGFYKSGR